MTAARKLSADPPPVQRMGAHALLEEAVLQAVASAAAAAAERSPKRMSAKELLAQGLKGADMKGFAEAARKYNGDAQRELADLRAGTHPLQRAR